MRYWLITMLGLRIISLQFFCRGVLGDVFSRQKYYKLYRTSEPDLIFGPVQSE